MATVLAEAKTQFEDGPQAHELTQKKLLSPEAQLISSILENCISKLEIAATLPPVLRLKSVPSVVDKELRRALQEYQLLAERLDELDGLEQESDGEQAGEAGESRKGTRAQLERDVKNSVRDLFRLVRDHPDAIFGLKAELGAEVGESEYILIRELKKFHIHMLEKLQTSPDEELQLACYMQVSSTYAHILEDMVSQEKKDTIAINEVDAKISLKNDEIKNLQSTLEEKRAQEVGMSLLPNKHCQSHIKTSKMRQTSIQQEIDHLNVQLNNLMIENRQKERLLQEKNEKVEKEIEFLLKNFDAEMEEIQANIESNEMEMEREEEELRELEKSYSVLEVEYDQIQERRRLAEEKRMEEMRELELKTKAAIFAQAWWRGYSTRKALKNKGKGKKAKKGKSKKATKGKDKKTK